MRVEPLKGGFNAEFSELSSDKSISHRCAIFSLLADGTSEISNYLLAEDTLNSLKIAEQLGAKVIRNNGDISITAPKSIKSPNSILECGNSGTAMRIYMGLLAASEGFFVLSGDEYLNERPMRRVAEPLIKIGAKISGKESANKAPLAIEGAKLKYFKYDSQIASAQIKSALILAGLLGEGCEFSEPELSRDHTERMLKGMGAKISLSPSPVATQMASNQRIKIEPLNGRKLSALKLKVPNDPSSCFFFAVAAAIVPNSQIKIRNMLLNKTRIEAFEVLKKMGADINYKLENSDYDDVGEVCIKYNGRLKAVKISENISWLIDEAPALAIAFACADGTSELRGAKELRVKECDRIAVTVAALNRCGIVATELEDGFQITGGEPQFSIIDSCGDHRIAMSFAILGLLCGMQIEKSEFIATSFPRFSHCLKQLGAVVSP